MPDINMKSTKELARELGLLRKRTSSAGSQYMKRIKKNKQSFAYLIVIDFESTCWQNVKYKTQEIIEFPAVLLNTSTGAVDAEFHHYVQPQEHPYLSDFCRELTGITQDQVDQGIPLSLTIKKFASWLQQLSNERNISYDVVSSHDNKCTFVTWSDWDLGVCLQYETRRKQIRKPVELNSWIDLRATYRNFYQRRPQGLNGALQDLGISFEGREHSGLCDARNTAKLAWRMMTDGCQLQVTKTLTPPLTGRAGPQKITIPKAIAAPQAQHCLPNDNSGQSKPQVSAPVNSFRTANGAAVEVTSNQKQNVIGPPRELLTNQSKTSTSRTTVASPEDPSETASTELISSYIDCNDTTEEGGTDSRATQQRKSRELHTVVPSTDQKHPPENQTCVPVLGSGSSTFKTTKTMTKKPVPQGNSFSIYCDKDDRKTPVPKSVTAGPSPIGISNCTNNFKIPSPVGVVKTKVGGPFKTPSPLCGRTYAPNSSSSGRPERKALQNRTNTITPRHTPSVHKPTPGTTTANYRTPNTSGSLLPASSNMKRTPPMCECGRRTHRKLVQSPGPNQGRAFYCCPAGRNKGTSPLDNTTRGFGGTKKQGCGFFKWETATKDPNLSVTSMTGSFVRNTSSTIGKSVVRTRSFVVPPLPQPNFNTPQSEQRGTTWKTLGSTGSSNTVGPLRY